MCVCVCVCVCLYVCVCVCVCVCVRFLGFEIWSERKRAVVKNISCWMLKWSYFMLKYLLFQECNLVQQLVQLMKALLIAAILYLSLSL